MGFCHIVPSAAELLILFRIVGNGSSQLVLIHTLGVDQCRVLQSAVETGNRLVGILISKQQIAGNAFLFRVHFAKSNEPGNHGFKQGQPQFEFHITAKL